MWQKTKRGNVQEGDSLYACRDNPISSLIFRQCSFDTQAHRSVADLPEKSIPVFLLLACAVAINSLMVSEPYCAMIHSPFRGYPAFPIKWKRRPPPSVL